MKGCNKQSSGMHLTILLPSIQTVVSACNVLIMAVWKKRVL